MLQFAHFSLSRDLSPSNHPIYSMASGSLLSLEQSIEIPAALTSSNPMDLDGVVTSLNPLLPQSVETNAEWQGYLAQEFIDRLDRVGFLATMYHPQADGFLRHWNRHMIKKGMSYSTPCARCVVAYGCYQSLCMCRVT